MTHYDATSVRLQLYDAGYLPLPNLDKRCMAKGWPTADFAKRELSRIATWEKRFPDFTATGVRIQNGLVMIDIDVDDVLAHALLDALAQIAPAVEAEAPMRLGGGTYKVALFCRTGATSTELPHFRLASHKWRRPEDADQHHMVEIFWSEAGSAECRKQAGAYGAHSLNEDGTVKRYYRWDADSPDLKSVPLQSLPLVTAGQMREIIDAFDRLAQAAGWQPLSKAQTVSYSAIIRDIDQHTRFQLEDGSEAAYAELQEGMRCTSSFHGEPGANATKCIVNMVQAAGQLGVWDFEECAWHLPERPAAAGLPELKAIAAAQGVEIPKPQPEWRERYVETQYPKASLHNARLAIEHLDIHCSDDVFHDKQYLACVTPMPFLGEVNDVRIGALRVWLSNSFGLDFTDKHVRDAVNTLCREHPFDPVLDTLVAAEAGWDGVERLDRMAVDYFNTADTELNRQCVRKTMIAAVARARVPGIKFDTILTMESVEGWNKSGAWLVLAGEGNFTDERMLGKDSRDVQELRKGKWIIEHADLAGLTKAEVETVKAFASRTSDRARPAYGHYVLEQPRRSIDVGTTNAFTQYMMSQTGNRRFWPIKIERSIDLAKLARDRLLLWGEAARYQTAGESLVLDERLWPLVGIEQEKRRVRDPWEGRLSKLSHAPKPQGKDPLSGLGMNDIHVLRKVEGQDRVFTEDLFEHALKIPPAQQHTGHSRRLADAMRRLGWEDGYFRIGKEGPKNGYKRATLYSKKKKKPKETNSVVKVLEFRGRTKTSLNRTHE